MPDAHFRILRTALLIAACAAIGAGLAAAPAHAQCGETVDVPARHAVLPGAPPLALGDSVLYDAAQPLAADGFHVNAMVCRTMGQGLAYLQPRAASLPRLVIAALGTNGTVSAADLDALLRIIGPSRGLALVTPKGGDDPTVPGLYRTRAQRHPGRIPVLDWERVSAGHADWFAPDRVHLGRGAGIAAFARLLAGSLSALPGGTSASGATPTIPIPTIPTPTNPATTTTTTATPPPPSSAVPAPRGPAGPRPTHRATFTAGERDALRRTILDVRLFLAEAITEELSPFAL